MRAELHGVSPLAVAALLASASLQAAPPAAAQDLESLAPALAFLEPEARDDATILLPGPDGDRVLRQGSGLHICLADEPGDDRLSVTCYHRALDPLLALERRLRRDGLRGDEFSARVQAEIDAGRVSVPSGAYQVSVSGDDARATGQPAGLTVYHLVYLPGATANEVGLSAEREPGLPYLHHAGRYDAHVMWSEAAASASH
ncbi:MAG: hypothetical protein ABFS34_07500 [Gemmatimonadota bacterium]